MDEYAIDKKGTIVNLGDDTIIVPECYFAFLTDCELSLDDAREHWPFYKKWSDEGLEPADIVSKFETLSDDGPVGLSIFEKVQTVAQAIGRMYLDKKERGEIPGGDEKTRQLIGLYTSLQREYFEAILAEKKQLWAGPIVNLFNEMPFLNKQVGQTHNRCDARVKAHVRHADVKTLEYRALTRNLRGVEGEYAKMPLMGCYEDPYKSTRFVDIVRLIEEHGVCTNPGANHILCWCIFPAHGSGKTVIIDPVHNYNLIKMIEDIYGEVVTKYHLPTPNKESAVDRAFAILEAEKLNL